MGPNLFYLNNQLDNSRAYKLVGELGLFLKNEYLQLLGNEQKTPSPFGWTAVLYGKSEPVTSLNTWKSNPQLLCINLQKSVIQKTGPKNLIPKI